MPYHILIFIGVKHDRHIKRIILVEDVSEKVLRIILEHKGEEITGRR
jgi:hypothetical protein